MIRLFVALHVPSTVRDEIFRIIKEIVPDHYKYKWENKVKIHLTLKFIGFVEEKLKEKIGNKLSFIENYNKFNFTLKEFNFFIRHGKPQILWLGIKTDDPLKKLVKEIEDSLIEFSILPEKREFKSHLTLMRIKENPGSDFINSFKNFKVPEIEFTSEKVVLMQSFLKQGGSEYKELYVYKLK